MSELPNGPVPDPILAQVTEDGLEELFRKDPLGSFQGTTASQRASVRWLKSQHSTIERGRF